MSRDYFDAIAPEWETMRHDFFTEDVREKAIALAPVRRGQRVVDVGAGTGFVTRGLVARGLSVLAVDASCAMLLGLRAQMSGAARVDCLVADAASLPIPSSSVAHIFGNMVLHHVDEPPHAIAEMVRVLRPGGSLVVTDLDAYDDPTLRDAHHDRWMGFARDTMQGWLAAAGLQDVSVQGTNECCCSGPSRLSIFAATGRKPARQARRADRSHPSTRTCLALDTSRRTALR